MNDVINSKFIDFVKGALPSVSKEIADEIKDLINKFPPNTNLKSWHTAHEQDLLQGDVVDGINFIFRDDAGSILITPIMKGMILSCSCDIENDDDIIAPVFPTVR